MTYDYLIVGAGFFGSICAHELTKAGYSVCVIDRRSHIGGNCYTEERDGIHIHVYGPHIFHTSNEFVWNWINQFTKFNDFQLNIVANYNDKIYSLPFNMWTFSDIYGITHPDELLEAVRNDSTHIDDPQNLEEAAIKSVGTKIYETLIKGYTEKQWRKPAHELPASIIRRLPLRPTYDNNYFNDTYQGIPVDGYTKIFEKLLDGIDVRLGVDYFDRNKLPKHSKVIFTGAIDELFNYENGTLEYKTTRFDHEFLNTNNYQGAAIMNYTSSDVKHTRVIEHKFFQTRFPDEISGTWITHEYPTEYIAGKTEPYYPVNDKPNTELYLQYKDKAASIPNLYLGGRLAEYKYYDMDDVILSALTFCEQELGL